MCFKTMMCSSTCVVMFPNPLWKQQQRSETKSFESEKGDMKIMTWVKSEHSSLLERGKRFAFFKHTDNP